MPILKRTSVHNLVPNKKYFIEVQWNIKNNLRIDNNYTLTGIFVKTSYIRGRTCSFDTGLKLLLSNSRFEVIFNVDGIDHIVSSVNKFYEIVNPPVDEIASIYAIYKLPLPIELKRIICEFSMKRLPLFYRRTKKINKKIL
jgi:hypothetical protein